MKRTQAQQQDEPIPTTTAELVLSLAHGRYNVGAVVLIATHGGVCESQGDGEVCVWRFPDGSALETGLKQ